jgi:hypothetical protein
VVAAVPALLVARLVVLLPSSPDFDPGSLKILLPLKTVKLKVRALTFSLKFDIICLNEI